ncbi:AAA family ATPase [Pelosinus sp. sgz500959]|uniref:AAA family ATPase n=1 Tax=Pelosinus sp. sgz500959 TaxID=3242472 RepID=UPI00366B1D29
MVCKLSIKQYRKIKDLEFDFTSGINAISGTNGTCKTSLLHIISNSFQAVNKNCTWIQDSTCIEIIKKINTITNPKVESLTRGDKQYNDPARGQKGSLFTIDYFNRNPLSFRRHNSISSNRYAIKPFYQRGSKDSLPYCPVVYLGLSRLLPFGEFQNDDAIEGIKKTLPLVYQEEVTKIYKEFTGITISSYTAPQKMGDIKIRADFSSDKDGIDSNTISAGEDNLFILITALVSLKYYYNCIESTKTVESILLIDEFDATLHPAFQFKLLNLFKDYSHNYKIQIIFTTHSLSLLENALDQKHNVIYLLDHITSVTQMVDPDIYKIKMFLKSITRYDIYVDKAIPIFTEDEEARLFLNIIFDYFVKNYGDVFSNVRQYFHFVKANLGANNLLDIFSDDKLLRCTMRSICILDGDQRSKRDLEKFILILPGADSPEELIMNYSKILFDKDDPFWTDDTILYHNFGKVYYRDNIRQDIDGIAIKLEELKSGGKSSKGVKREENKKVFNKHKRFFELLFKHWVNNGEHKHQLEKFYKDLQIMFIKVSEFHEISPKEWKIQ